MLAAPLGETGNNVLSLPGSDTYALLVKVEGYYTALYTENVKLAKEWTSQRVEFMTSCVCFVDGIERLHLRISSRLNRLLSRLSLSRLSLALRLMWRSCC